MKREGCEALPFFVPVFQAWNEDNWSTAALYYTSDEPSSFAALLLKMN